MTQHTPGPWIVNMGRTVAHIVGTDGHGVCGVSTVGFKGFNAVEHKAWRERGLANARLIAAAPALLGALLNAKGFLDPNSEAFEMAARAINAATTSTEER